MTKEECRRFEKIFKTKLNIPRIKSFLSVIKNDSLEEGIANKIYNDIFDKLGQTYYEITN